MRIYLFTLMWAFSAFTLAGAQLPDHYKVLLINAWQKNLPWHHAIQDGIEKGFKQQGISIDLYVEHLDSTRFEPTHYWPEIARHLSKKYQHKNIDVVIAEGVVGVSFMQQYRHMLSANAHLLVPPSYFEVELIEGDSLAKVDHDFTETILEISQSRPFKKVMVVANTTRRHEQLRLDAVIQSLERTNTPYELLDNLPLARLKQRLQQIDPHCAVFYLPLFTESKTVSFSNSPKHVLKQLANVSNAPIYSAWGSLLGSGIVGGRMIQGESLGPMIADIASNIIRQGSSHNLVVRPYQSQYDFRLLDRWNIDPKRLPKDARIINHSENFLRTYFWQITSFFFAFFTLLITSFFLISSNRRRRKHLLELWQERDSLEQRINERTLQLQASKAKAEQLARTDPLTELNNRRAFYEQASDIHQSANRYQHPTTAAIIDLDNFKQINDQYGHDVGDAVLIAVADTIKSTLRGTDLAGRIGGEEFAAIITDTPASEATIAAERIRKAVEELCINSENQQVRVTLSIGLAELANDDASIDTVLKRADLALYSAKAKGRNQVARYPDCLYN